MRSRLEVLGNWFLENWLLLIAPPFIFVILVLLLYSVYTADPDLSDRSRRVKIFSELETEMKGLEVPTSSAINDEEGRHKQGSILILRRFRSDANPTDFFKQMDENLKRRGWISYEGEQDQSAVRTLHYCRGKQDASLYLEGKAVFDSRPGDYWKLIFSVGLRAKPGIFGRGVLPADCSDS